MIIGGDRLVVIENIKKRISKGELNAKVEEGDPRLSREEEKEITDAYVRNRKSHLYRLKRFFACLCANIGAHFINRDTEIVGDVDPRVLEKGFIITSNHFSPFENTVIRRFVRKKGKKNLCVVSQVSNFAMKGFVGFLMNYADTIPLSSNLHYFTHELTDILDEKLSNGEAVLIYPEQEMWFNYRKPRPHKEGAYHFASRLNSPIISCFVEIINKGELDTIDFYKVKYRLHILGVLYPDENLSLQENRKMLCGRDFELKKGAYERIYKKKLEYKFESSDIGGWIDYGWVTDYEG